MFSLRCPVPLLNTPSSSSSFFYYRSYYPPYHRSQTRGLAVTKRRTVAVESPEPIPEELAAELMPKHVAVIMDGNGRWAKLRNLPASAGHQAGVQSLRRMVTLCCSWGIKVLTVFAFSTDNWARPKVVNVYSYPTSIFTILEILYNFN